MCVHGLCVCVCVCVCVYVCVYVWVCVCVHARVACVRRACVRGRVCERIWARTHGNNIFAAHACIHMCVHGHNIKWIIRCLGRDDTTGAAVHSPAAPKVRGAHTMQTTTEGNSEPRPASPSAPRLLFTLALLRARTVMTQHSLELRCPHHNQPRALCTARLCWRCCGHLVA
jgi:hypothetical protein